MIVNRLLQNKQIVLFTGCACVGVYVAYRYWKKRLLCTIDEGFEDVTKIDESNYKRIVLVGLHSSGKSTLMKHIKAGSKNECNISSFPSYDFVIYKYQRDKYNFEIWEIGGHSDSDNNWNNFLNDVDLLVFMVDATDHHRLAIATTIFKELLADVRLHSVPVLIVANKQDLPTALSPDEVREALDVKSLITHKDKIHVVGCEMGPTPKDHSSKSEWYHTSAVDVFNKIFTLAVHS